VQAEPILYIAPETLREAPAGASLPFIEDAVQSVTGPHQPRASLLSDRTGSSTDELADVEVTVTIADASGQMDGDGARWASADKGCPTVVVMVSQHGPERELNLLCLPCMMGGDIRRAWTVSAGRACCIRHAVEDSELDDMNQHDLFVTLYEALRQRGYTDPY
jgi:hypothetical protein